MGITQPEEADARSQVGGERIDANGKSWHLRHIRDSYPSRSPTRPHCSWCGLFIDVIAYFDAEFDDEYDECLHEDCLEQHNQHIGYMASSGGHDRHGNP